MRVKSLGVSTLARILSVLVVLHVHLFFIACLEAQHGSGESFIRAACENNLATTKYDVLVDHWSSTMPVEEVEKEPGVSYEQVEKIRIIVDLDLERCICATKRTFLRDGGLGKFHNLDYSLQIYQDGECIEVRRVSPKGNNYGQSRIKATFTKFMARVPCVPMISITGFSMHGFSEEQPKRIATLCEKYKKSTALLLPDGTVIVTYSEGDPQDEKKPKGFLKYFFSPNCLTPSKYINKTEFGKNTKYEVNSTVESEEVDGLFRPVSVTYDKLEPWFGGKTGQVASAEKVGTVQIQWLQFGGDKIDFPETDTLLKNWQNDPSLFGGNPKDAGSGNQSSKK